MTLLCKFIESLKLLSEINISNTYSVSAVMHIKPHFIKVSKSFPPKLLLTNIKLCDIITRWTVYLSYRESTIRITALWVISTTFWNFPHFSPCETGGRKPREISICCRNCSQGSCSYSDFPLEHDLFKNVSSWVTFLWQMQTQTIEYDLNKTEFYWL